MRIRPVLVLLLALTLSACGGGPTGSTHAGGATSPVATGAATTASAAPIDSPSAEIDLSSVDACKLLDDATLTALTGVTGFITDQRDNTHCFWAIPRPGEPQYVEIHIDRTASLFLPTFPESTCTSAAVTVAGAEALGGTCSSPQKKVHLVVRNRGVSVTVLVNEPQVPLTPADLVETGQSILTGLE
jgi:hypothetical protein